MRNYDGKTAKVYIKNRMREGGKYPDIVRELHGRQKKAEGGAYQRDDANKPHHSAFQRRNRRGMWSGGFVRKYADGGGVKKDEVPPPSPKPDVANDDDVIERALRAAGDYAGRGLAVADVAMGGTLSALAGLNPFTSFAAVREARDRALRDVPRDIVGIAAENPMGISLPFFAFRRGAKAAQEGGAALERRLAELRAEADRLYSLGATKAKGPQPRGGYATAEDEIKWLEHDIAAARAQLPELRAAYEERMRNVGQGPRALKAPPPGGSIPEPLPAGEHKLAEFGPDDYVYQHAGGLSLGAVRAANDPRLAERMAAARRQRDREEFLRNLGIADEMSGAAAARAQAKQDARVDDIVSGQLRGYRDLRAPNLEPDRVAPRRVLKGFERYLVNEGLDPLSKGALSGPGSPPIPMEEAVASMVRRGYALPGMNMSVLQKNLGGLGGWQKMTRADKEFRDAVWSNPQVERILRRILDPSRNQKP